MTPPRIPGPFPPDHPTSPGRPFPPDRPTTPDRPFPPDRPSSPGPPVGQEPPAVRVFPRELPPWQSPPLFPEGGPHPPEPPARPSGKAGAVTSMLDEILARLKAGLEQMSDAYNRFVEAVRRGSAMLPGILLAGAQGALEKVRQLVEAAVRVGSYALEHAAPMVALILTSFNWLDDVAAPVTAIAGKTANSDIDLFEWEGKAANVYRSLLGRQEAAARQVAATADGISAWLLRITQDNVGYVKSLTDLVISLAAALAQAAVEASTGIGIPFAIKTLTGEIGTIVEGVGTHVADGVSRLMDTLGNVRDIESMIALADRTWPQMVTG